MSIKYKTSSGWKECLDPQGEFYSKSEAYTQDEADTLLDDKANITDIYTKTESDDSLELLSNKVTSLSSTDIKYPSAKITYTTFNNKLSLSGGTMTGHLNMGTNAIDWNGYSLHSNNGKLYYNARPISFLGVADKSWTALTLTSAVTAGTIYFGCKNNIVFIEGTNLSISSQSGVFSLAQLPSGYYPTIEVKGSGWSAKGETFKSMVWADSSGYIYAHSTFSPVLAQNGKLFLSYQLA